MDYKVRDREGVARGGGGGGGDFIIHNARADHATSDIYPDFDWSKVSLPAIATSASTVAS